MLNATLIALHLVRQTSISPLLSFANLATRNLRSDCSVSNVIRCRGNLFLCDSFFRKSLRSAVVLSEEYDTENISGVFRENTRVSFKNMIISNCVFHSCSSSYGGGLYGDWVNTTLTDCVFYNNGAHIGGAVHILHSDYIFMQRILMIGNVADYCGAGEVDVMNEANDTHIELVNVTGNSANKWTGGLRVDHGGGVLKECVFSENSAAVCGGFFDYAWDAVLRSVSFCMFLNNTSTDRGGAFTGFHLLHHSYFEFSFFIENRCEKAVNSISIESFGASVSVYNCIFTGSEDDEVGVRWKDGSTKQIRESHFNEQTETVTKFAHSKLATLHKVTQTFLKNVL